MSKNLKIRLLVVVSVIAACLYFALPLDKKVNLGLDLQGGMHLVMKVDTEKLDEEAKKDAVPRAIEILRNRIDQLGVAEPVIQRQGENQIIVQLPGVTDRDKAKELIGTVAQLDFSMVNEDPNLLNEALSTETNPPGYLLKQIKGKPDFILVAEKPALTGDTIANAMVDFNSAAFGEPQISFTLNGEGAKTFARLTRAHVNDRLAILLDGEVLSAPNISEPILSGRGVITGQFTVEEASLLALALRSGSLPAPMHVEEERTIGPLLGQDSIRAGVTASVFGGIAVLIFMLIYYLKAGIISDIVLLCNLVIIVGVMGALNFLLPGSKVTLTLPGIAGIILTMGMAVDANILINERIREELANGRPMHAAISSGFHKALSAILDGNLTTLIAAFMLFQFGSGPIKGFAVTLTIGLSASLFTAIFVNRTLFLLFLEMKALKSLPMLQAFSNPNIDFVSKRHICIVLSILLIGIGLFSFFQKQDTAYGIDFAGGQVQEYRFQKPVEAQALRDIFKANGIHDLVIQGFDKHPENIIIRSAQDTDKDIIKIFNEQMADNPFEIMRIETVGPVVGKDLRKRAVSAVVFALAGILVYVGFRFHHFDFATTGVIALLHDVVITLGFLSLMGRQVDLLVITALLTIAGYSINDTIVIYDRIRENMPKFKKMKFRDILNTSINQTLSRTILTTFTTLITVTSIYLFGGETLNTFALSLIIGFVAGTYSTVFIAVPLVLAWQKNKT
ncbi:MAG TPA: protein translocase subunit SecD [Candidatus Omnitrophota bacterium]|nr:protein translocase subunit SecD [Candidatus Omnitrophota bacterium]HQO58090.1 protein translocase subunit SecD [Candidatus Omnitrophota bacterium]